tara:strand:+ start:310 stop:1527 length:1218 start_codon:yes stop_codon:yes gene_type:complete
MKTNNIVKIFPYYIILIFFSTIYSIDKSSKDIQEEINLENSRINNLKYQIESLEKKINSNMQSEKEAAESIHEIDLQISLTKKLINAISKEEILLKRSVNLIEQEIYDKKYVHNNLKKQLIDRAVNIYKNNKKYSNLENLLLSKDWNESTYKMKYLNSINNHEREVKDSIQVIINDLNLKKKQKISAVNRKKFLKKDKIIETNRLANKKKSRDKYLGNLKTDSRKLRREMNTKENSIAEIESIIKKLYKDKEKSKKIELELAKIRSKKNISPKDNFRSMRGKLQWPTNGRIVKKYGNIRNPQTKTITINPGIDIKSKAKSSVKSVLDGVVSKIDFIPNYGSIIIIEHGEGYFSVYSNVDEIIINENDYIQSGQKIAQVSNATSQLHFQVWSNAKSLNPEKWLRVK